MDLRDQPTQTQLRLGHNDAEDTFSGDTEGLLAPLSPNHMETGDSAADSEGDGHDDDGTEDVAEDESDDTEEEESDDTEDVAEDESDDTEEEESDHTEDEESMDTAMFLSSEEAAEEEPRVNAHAIRASIEEDSVDELRKRLGSGTAGERASVCYAYTPLQLAICIGATSVVQYLLLERKVTPTLTKEGEHTVLDLAVGFGRSEFLPLLLEHFPGHSGNLLSLAVGLDRLQISQPKPLRPRDAAGVVRCLLSGSYGNHIWAAVMARGLEHEDSGVAHALLDCAGRSVVEMKRPRPLEQACKSGRSDILPRLLQLGCEVTSNFSVPVPDVCDTALDVARLRCILELVRGGHMPCPATFLPMLWRCVPLRDELAAVATHVPRSRKDDVKAVVEDTFRVGDDDALSVLLHTKGWLQRCAARVLLREAAKRRLRVDWDRALALVRAASIDIEVAVGLQAGSTPLLDIAVRRDVVHVVSFLLLQLHVAPWLIVEDQLVPLFVAAVFYGSEATASFSLPMLPVEYCAGDSVRQTAVEHLLRSRSTDLLHQLIAHSASKGTCEIHLSVNDVWSALERGCFQSLCTLLYSGVSCAPDTRDGESLLHRLVASSHFTYGQQESLVKAMVSAGARLDGLENGFTVLDVALRGSGYVSPTLVAELIQGGPAGVTTHVAPDHVSVLQCAMARADPDVIRLLVSHGALGNADHAGYADHALACVQAALDARRCTNVVCLLRTEGFIPLITSAPKSHQALINCVHACGHPSQLALVRLRLAGLRLVPRRHTRVPRRILSRSTQCARLIEAMRANRGRNLLRVLPPSLRKRAWALYLMVLRECRNQLALEGDQHVAWTHAKHVARVVTIMVMTHLCAREDYVALLIFEEDLPL